MSQGGYILIAFFALNIRHVGDNTFTCILANKIGDG